ncbi:hypothetical protein V2G26_008568 [Clonostachys chloroleuca]
MNTINGRSLERPQAGSAATATGSRSLEQPREASSSCSFKRPQTGKSDPIRRDTGECNQQLLPRAALGSCCFEQPRADRKTEIVVEMEGAVCSFLVKRHALYRKTHGATMNFLNFVSSFFVPRYDLSLYVPTSGKMSLSAVDPSAPAPDWDIEWPDFSPPPAAPTPPPLPEVVQFDLLSPPSLEALMEEGDARLDLLRESVRKDRLGQFVAHLSNSTMDWSLSLDEVKNGKCLVEGIDCTGTQNSLSEGKLRKHYNNIKHKNWDIAEGLAHELDETSPEPGPPRLDMRPTVTILFKAVAEPPSSTTSSSSTSISLVSTPARTPAPSPPPAKKRRSH